MARPLALKSHCLLRIIRRYEFTTNEKIGGMRISVKFDGNVIDGYTNC